MKISTIERTKDGVLPSSLGGYPLLYGSRWACLCSACATVRENDIECIDPVLGADIYWEGAPLICEDCSNEIESAYGDPDEERE
jgi:hypothetical protein